MLNTEAVTFDSSGQMADAPVLIPPMESLELQAYIPHRYPFLLVDRVTYHEKEVRIQGFKNLTINEGFFQGHFPHLPVMPGVLQIEALAQLGGVMLAFTELGKDKTGFFAGLENVRFRRMVTPGDRLDLEMTVVAMRSKIAKMRGVAKVDGQVAVEADMMFSLLPKA
jgi:3-hydroxyacyl-[acyl-carrier-protein] dehydratase